MINKDITGATINNTAWESALEQPVFDMKLYKGNVESQGIIKRATLKLGAGEVLDMSTENFEVGVAYTTSFTAEVYDFDFEVNDFISVNVGLEVNGSFVYVNVANCTITSSSVYQRLYTIEGVGVLSDDDYNEDCGVHGTMTAAQIISAVSAITGDTITCTNTSASVTLDENTSCKEAIEKVALAIGGYAFEKENTVAIVGQTRTETYVLPDVVTRVDNIASDDYTVTGLTVVNDATTSVYTYGDGRLIIDTNMNSDQASALWTALNGYSYRPALLQSAIINPRLEPSDMLHVTFGSENYLVPCRGLTITYDGGYFGTISAAGLTQAAEETLPKSRVDVAEQAAKEASAAVNAVNQHFWHDTQGAHVTDERKDEFVYAEAHDFPDWQPDPEQPDYKPWYNVLLNSLGQVFRTGSRYLASFTHSAIAFFDGLGNEAENILAVLGAEGIRLGKEGASSVSISTSDVSFINSDNAYVFEVDMDGEQSVYDIRTELPAYYEGANPTPIQENIVVIDKTVSVASEDCGVEDASIRFISFAWEFVSVESVSNCTCELSGQGGPGYRYANLRIGAQHFTAGTPTSFTATVSIKLAEGGMYGGGLFNITAEYTYTGSQVRVRVFYTVSAATAYFFTTEGTFYVYRRQDTTLAKINTAGIIYNSSPQVRDSGVQKYQDRIMFYDNDRKAIGYLRTPFLSDGREGIQFETQRTVNGSIVYNGLNFYIAPNGTRSVELHEAQQWLNALGLTTQKSTPAVADVITAASGITITNVYVAKWGRVMTLQITFTRSTATAASAWFQLGTLKEGYRPAYLVNIGSRYYMGNAGSNGVINICNISGGQINAGASISVGSTWILA